MAKWTLDEVQAELLERRAVLIERMARVERDLARCNDPLVADSADRAIQLQNDETLGVILRTGREELAAIDEALQRLKLNLYGICDRCGQRIPESRLWAAPFATRCATCVDIHDPE